MNPILNLIAGIILSGAVGSSNAAEGNDVTSECTPAGNGGNMRVYLNREGADREIIHVDSVGWETAGLGSPVKFVLAHLVISDTTVAIVMIEKVAMITGAKIVVVEKDEKEKKWKTLVSRTLFTGRKPFVPVLVVPERSESPFSIRRISKTELLVEFDAGARDKISEKVVIQAR